MVTTRWPVVRLCRAGPAAVPFGVVGGRRVRGCDLALQSLQILYLLLGLLDGLLLLLLLVELLFHKGRGQAARVLLRREQEVLQLSHEGTHGIAHEPGHVNLHALGAEWIVHGRGAILQLGMRILSNDLIFHAHELWNALLHPVLDHVDLHLQGRNENKRASQSKCDTRHYKQGNE